MAALALISIAVAVLASLQTACSQPCSDVSTSQYLDSSGKYAIEYDTIQGWYRNRTTWYWDFGPRSAAAGPTSDPGSVVLAAPIWVPFYENGDKAGNNIIDVVPCQAEYSDLWEVHLVTVPDGSPMDMYKDAATVKEAIANGTLTEKVPGAMVNCPVAPFNSSVVDTHSPNPNVTGSLPASVFGWYRGQQVFYFDYGGVATNITQPVWPIFTQSGDKAGQNLIDVIPGDPGYTPFWQVIIVTVPDSLGNNMTRSRQVASAYPMNKTANIANCPVAYTTPDNSSMAPPTPANSPSQTSSCMVPFMGQMLSFAQCLTLDTAGAFSLAWKPRNSSSPGVFTVLFTGTPQQAYGWAAWGISPNGLMPGTDAIVGFGSSANTAMGKAGVYHMNGFAPALVDPAQASNGRLLSPEPGSLSLEFLNSGATVSVLADVAGLGNGPVTVVWRSGPSADVSTGQLASHGDLSRVSRAVDFATGAAEGADTTTSNKNQKIAHAFLAAIGFGVLLPAGILVARHVKVWADPLWFFAHIGLQVGGYVVGVTGWSIGIWLKTQFGDISVAPSYQIAHYGIGVAIFCTSTLQVLTPILKPHKEASVRLYWNLVHWGLGYSTVILAFVNIFLGFSILAAEYISYGGWRTAYIVLLCVWGALLILLEPVSWYKYFENKKIEQEQAAPMHKTELEKPVLDNKQPMV